MAALNLSAIETRVLGCLLEKERLTPENYPLSLHSLTAACNQLTNREPITAHDEKTVEAGVNALREKKLATAVFGAGSRVQKYRHNLLSHYELAPPEVALIAVLLLRGPQTPGELRARTERMHGFASLEELEKTLEELGRGDTPLIRLLPPRPGQKERRYVQLLSDETLHEESATEPPTLAPRAPQHPVESQGRIEALELELATLRTELAALREEFVAFRRQFE
jgi:uncharacterized protein YceH (UPF0502 family)